MTGTRRILSSLGRVILDAAGKRKIGTTAACCCGPFTTCDQCEAYTATSQSATTAPTSGTRIQLTDVTLGFTPSTSAQCMFDQVLPAWLDLLAGWNPSGRGSISNGFVRLAAPVNLCDCFTNGECIRSISVTLQCDEGTWFAFLRGFRSTDGSGTASISVTIGDGTDPPTWNGSCCSIELSGNLSIGGVDLNGSSGPGSMTFTVIGGPC